MQAAALVQFLWRASNRKIAGIELEEVCYIYMPP